MSEDQFRISEFKKVLRRYTSDGFVDLDKNYLHKFNVQIHRFEDVLRDSRMESPPNRWSYHRIGLIKEGGGEITTGIHKFQVRKNTLIIIPSRVISSSREWTHSTRGYILLFNIDFFLENNFSHQFFDNKKILTTSIIPYMYLSDEQSEMVSPLFETILTEKKQKLPANNELIAVKILELLICAESLFNQLENIGSNRPNSNIIENFTQLLEIHLVKEHSVKYYAERLFIHPNRLNAVIKQHTGLSAKETIQIKLMQEIKYLLHSTSLSVKQISGQLGFKDPNYFTTFFKRAENISPVHYRSSFS